MQLDTVPTSRWGLLDRVQILKFALLLGFLVLFLLGSRLPSEFKKVSQAEDPTFQAGSINFKERFAIEADASFMERFFYTSLNFWDANTNGMTFAIIIGGAATALLVSSAVVRGVVSRRGLKGSIIGTLLGIPLNMCANCSAVTSCGIGQGRATAETKLGVILGSSLFNIIGLAAILALFPTSVFVARLAFAVVLTFVVLPLASRWLSPSIPVTADTGVDAALQVQVSWWEALKTTLRDWWQSSATLAYNLLPVMIAATMLTALVRILADQGLLGATSAGAAVGIIAVAFFGSFLSIPVLFEIPLAYLVASLGFGIGPVAAMICTAPSIGLFTVLLVRQEVGWKLILVMWAATFVLGVAAGFLAQALA